MPRQQRGRTSSQDFAFQSTDQAFAHPFGGAPAPAFPQAFPHQQPPRYETGPATNESITPTTTTSGSALDYSLRYSDFAVSQGSASYPGTSVPPPGSSRLGPGGPLAWDWGEIANYTPRYEPQGELFQDSQIQQARNDEFSIPLPVTATDIAHQSPPQRISAQPAVPQEPLSLHPKSHKRPSFQASMKRKAESELDPGIQAANGPVDESPAKRQSQSRASSISSVASPVAVTATAPTTTATVNESSAHLGSEAQKRRDSSKGTGPQGRVIDVSTPRRIVESRGVVETLPSGKVFPIQIGSALFRLSGASISSDGEHQSNTYCNYTNIDQSQRLRTFRISLESRSRAVRVAPVT